MAQADSPSITRRALVRLAPVAAFATIIADPAQAEEAELIDLGRQLQRVSIEIEAAGDDHEAVDVLCNRGTRIVNEILGYSADTLPGLRSTCYALIWIHGGRREEWDCKHSFDLVENVLALSATEGL
jgi:hypothetical protein